jgi:arylsulfatase A-like enzyme
MGESKASPRDAMAMKTSQAIFSIREGKWKLVEHDSKNPTGRKSENTNQLFDLDSDPAEESNVYDDYPEVVEQLKKELAKVK